MPSSAISDAQRVTKRALAILTAQPALVGRGAIVAITVPFVFLIVGVPLLGHALTSSYRKAARGTLEPGTSAGAGTNVVASLSFATYALTVLVASVLAIAPPLAPFYFAFVAFTGLLSLAAASSTMRGGLAEGLGRIAAAVTTRPASLALALGLPIGLHTVLSVLLVSASSGSSFGSVLMLLVLVVVATTQIAVLPAIDEIVLAPRAEELPGPPFGVLAWLLPAPLLMLLAALGVSLILPLGAWQEAPGAAPDDARVVHARLLLREDSGLAVDITADAHPHVVVSAADGGGCGPIGGLVGSPPVTVRETTFAGVHAYELRGHGRLAYVDDDGVRLDDGLLDRLRERTWRAPAILALAGLLLIALLVRSMRRSAREASLLASRAPRDAGPKETVAIAGKLVLEGDATVTNGRRGRSVIRGVVRFRSGDGALTFVIPEGERAIDRDETAPVSDGADAFVVAAASALRAASYREGPGREALVVGVGAIDRARQAYLTRAGRVLGWLGLPAATLLLLASLVIATRWLLPRPDRSPGLLARRGPAAEEREERPHVDADAEDVHLAGEGHHAEQEREVDPVRDQREHEDPRAPLPREEPERTERERRARADRRSDPREHGHVRLVRDRHTDERDELRHEEPDRERHLRASRGERDVHEREHCDPDQPARAGADGELGRCRSHRGEGRRCRLDGGRRFERRRGLGEGWLGGDRHSPESLPQLAGHHVPWSGNATW